MSRSVQALPNTPHHVFPSENISFHSSVAGKHKGKSPIETHSTHLNIVIIIILFIYFLTKKIPIATSSVYFMEMKMHSHFNNKADNASTSFYVCHMVKNIENQSIQWGLWVFSCTTNNPRTLIRSFQEYKRR